MADRRRVSVVAPSEMKYLMSFDDGEDYLTQSFGGSQYRTLSGVDDAPDDVTRAHEVLDDDLDDAETFSTRLMSAVRLGARGIPATRHSSVGSIATTARGGSSRQLVGGDPNISVFSNTTTVDTSSFMRKKSSMTSVFYHQHKEQQLTMLQRIQGCMVRHASVEGDMLNHQYEQHMTAAQLREKLEREEDELEQHRQHQQVQSVGQLDETASSTSGWGARTSPLQSPTSSRRMRSSASLASGASFVPIATPSGSSVRYVGGTALADLQSIRRAVPAARVLMPELVAEQHGAKVDQRRGVAGVKTANGATGVGNRTSPSTRALPPLLPSKRTDFAALAEEALASPRTRRISVVLAALPRTSEVTPPSEGLPVVIAAGRGRKQASSAIPGVAEPTLLASRLPTGVRPTSFDPDALEALSTRIVRERLPGRADPLETSRLDSAKIAQRISRERESMPRSEHLEKKLRREAEADAIARAQRAAIAEDQQQQQLVVVQRRGTGSPLGSVSRRQTSAMDSPAGGPPTRTLSSTLNVPADPITKPGSGLFSATLHGIGGSGRRVVSLIESPLDTALRSPRAYAAVNPEIQSGLSSPIEAVQRRDTLAPNHRSRAQHQHASIAAGFESLASAQSTPQTGSPAPAPLLLDGDEPFAAAALRSTSFARFSTSGTGASGRGGAPPPRASPRQPSVILISPPPDEGAIAVNSSSCGSSGITSPARGTGVANAPVGLSPVSADLGSGSSSPVVGWIPTAATSAAAPQPRATPRSLAAARNRKKSTTVADAGFWRSGFGDGSTADDDGVPIFEFELDRIRSEARSVARDASPAMTATAMSRFLGNVSGASAAVESATADARNSSISSLFATSVSDDVSTLIAGAAQTSRSSLDGSDVLVKPDFAKYSHHLLQLRDKLKKLERDEARAGAGGVDHSKSMSAALGSLANEESIGGFRRGGGRVRLDGVGHASSEASSSGIDLNVVSVSTGPGGRSIHERRKKTSKWQKFDPTPFSSSLLRYEEAVATETEPLPSEFDMNIPLQDLHLYQLFCAHRKMTIILRPVSNAVPNLYAGVAFLDKKYCDAATGLPLPQPQLSIEEVRRNTVFECRAKGKSISVSLKSSSYPPIDGLIPVNPALGKAFLEAQKREREIEDMILSAQGGVMTVALLRKLKAQKAQAGSLTAAFVRDIEKALKVSDEKCGALWQRYKEEVVATVDKASVSRRYIDQFNEAQFLGTTEAKWRGLSVFYAQIELDKVLRDDHDVPIFYIKKGNDFFEYDPVMTDLKKDPVTTAQKATLKPVLVVTHRTFFIASTTQRIEEEEEAYIIGPDFDGLAYAANIWADVAGPPSPSIAAAVAAAATTAAANTASLQPASMTHTSSMLSVNTDDRRVSDVSSNGTNGGRRESAVSEPHPQQQQQQADSPTQQQQSPPPAPQFSAPPGGNAAAWSLDRHIAKAKHDTSPELVNGMGLVTGDDIEHIKEMRQLTAWKQNHGYESGNTIKSQPITRGAYVTITPTCIRLLNTFTEIIGYYRHAWLDGTILLLNPNWKVCIDPIDNLPVPYGEELALPIIDDCGYATLLLNIDQLKSTTITYDSLMAQFTPMDARVAEKQRALQSGSKKAHKGVTDHVRAELFDELCLVMDKKHMAQLFYEVRRWQLYPPWFVSREGFTGPEMAAHDGFESYRSEVVAEKMAKYVESERLFEALHPGSTFLQMLSAFLRPDPPDVELHNSSILGANLSMWRDVMRGGEPHAQIPAHRRDNPLVTIVDDGLIACTSASVSPANQSLGAGGIGIVEPPAMVLSPSSGKR